MPLPHYREYLSAVERVARRESSAGPAETVGPAANREDVFEVVRLSDLASDPELTKPLPWLIPGLVPQGTAILLYGSPKVGKTTLAAAISAAVALGENFLGRVVSSGPVLYCDMERPRRLTVA